MIREITYRVRILRNGAPCGELHWSQDNPPQLTSSADAAIKTSLSGTFLPGSGINWLSDEIQPCIVINGVETPLCTLRVTTVSGGESAFRQFCRVDAYDRCWIVQTGKTENRLYFASGRSYISAINSLLLERGVVNVVSDGSSATLPAARDWNIGTDYLSIVNTLLSEIGYNSLWFDAAGFAHLQAYAAPSAGAIKRRYSASDIRLAPMGRDYTEQTDIFNAPNVFICVCDNPDRSSTLKATAENEHWGAKSILQRGLRIPEVVKVDQVADSASLQIRANKLRDDSLMSTRAVTISVPAEPGHGVGDVISIEHPEIGGIYREIGWSLRLAPGELIKISARRTVIM